MEHSNNNQDMIPADTMQCEMSNQTELDEETLVSVQGGALTPAEVAHMTRISEEASAHSGVGVGATATDYLIGAGVEFAAYTAGHALTKKKTN